MSFTCGFEWGDPPDVVAYYRRERAGRRNYFAMLEIVKSQPGRWARVVPEYSSERAAATCAHSLSDRYREFEFCSSGRNVYVRAIPDTAKVTQ